MCPHMFSHESARLVTILSNDTDSRHVQIRFILWSNAEEQDSKWRGWSLTDQQNPHQSDQHSVSFLIATRNCRMWTQQNSVSHQIGHTNASDRIRSQQIGGQNVSDRIEACYQSGHNRRQIALSGIQSYQTINNHDLWQNLAKLTTTHYE